MRALVGVDLHDRGEEVAREAGAWAERLGATVDLLYVAPWPVTSLYVEEPAIRAVLDEQLVGVRQAHRRTLERILRSLPAAQQGEAVVVEGAPGREIVDRAGGYDLVVVATHGRTGLGHLFLGSVAERVVRTAPVPVLVLRIDPSPVGLAEVP